MACPLKNWRNSRFSSRRASAICLKQPGSGVISIEVMKNWLRRKGAPDSCWIQGIGNGIGEAINVKSIKPSA